MNEIDVWWWLFSYGTHNMTVELGVGGQRMVFTADPENIRAVLATQFDDYGKGEPFHEGIIERQLTKTAHLLTNNRLERFPGGFHFHDRWHPVVRKQEPFTPSIHEAQGSRLRYVHGPN